MAIVTPSPFTEEEDVRTACSPAITAGRGYYELLTVTEELRKLILKSADANQLRDMARHEGMITLLEDGVEKIRAGVTTLSEVFRVTQEA